MLKSSRSTLNAAQFVLLGCYSNANILAEFLERARMCSGDRARETAPASDLIYILSISVHSQLESVIRSGFFNDCPQPITAGTAVTVAQPSASVSGRSSPVDLIPEPNQQHIFNTEYWTWFDLNYGSFALLSQLLKQQSP